MAQEFIRRDRQEPSEPEAGPEPVKTPAVKVSQVDAVLDEIDEVLELNAESFVRGFVQKGGQ